MNTRILLVFVALAALAIVVVLIWLAPRNEPTVSAATDAAALRSLVSLARADESQSATARATGQRAEAFAEPPVMTSEDAVTADEMLEVVAVNAKDGSRAPGAELLFAEDDGNGDTFRAWLRDGEVEQRLVPHGVSNADGILLMQRPARSGVVVARHDGAWGCLHLGKNCERRVEVELIADTDVTVRVVDERGSPVNDARVALGLQLDGWPFDKRLTSTSGSDGIAVLRHVGFVIANDPDAFRRAWSIALDAALDPRVEVEFAARNPPQKVVQLVMPATGECEVHVLDSTGAPHTDAVDVSLSFLGPEANLNDRAWRDYSIAANLQSVRGGTAIFPRVQIGGTMRALVMRASGGCYYHAVGLGPTVAGQRAVITVRIDEFVPLLVGRVLDAGGSALANTKLRVAIGSACPDDFEFTDPLTSDAAGHFEVETNSHEPGEETAILTICTVGDHDQEFAVASRELPADLGVGTHDVGDMELVPSPLLIAGVVVDDQGRPIRGAIVTLLAQRFYDESDPYDFYWEDESTICATSDKQGHFEIHGCVDARALGVRARTRELQGPPVRAAPGESDVIVKLFATGGVAGRVQIDASIPRDALMVILSSESDDPDRTLVMDPSVPLGENGEFSFKSLSPGSYVVRLWGANPVCSLGEVSDVQVEAAEVTRDRRLDPFELSATLRSVQLDIRDAAGVPIGVGHLQVQELTNPASPMSSLQFNNHKVVLFHHGGGLNVTVSAGDGYCSESLSGITSDQIVVLHRLVSVHFRLNSTVPLPELPLHLGVGLEPADGRDSQTHRCVFGSMEFGTAREIEVNAPVGRRAKVVLEVGYGQAGWIHGEYTGEPARFIEITDDSSKRVFDVNFDSVKVAEQSSALRKLLGR